jgi:hypothetical protein
VEVLKLILDWTAAMAWPSVVLFIVVFFRAPLLALLERIGAIADRAGREAFDLQLGEKLKISFKEAIKQANPRTVEEAVKVAEKEAEKAINIFESLSRIPMQQHHKDLLLKIAKGGDKGIHWVYKGPEDIAPGRTMGYLLQKNLVRRDGDQYFVHPVVRDYIFEVHGNAKEP